MDPARVLAAVDFRPASLYAARWAAGVAGPGAQIELAHVLPSRTVEPEHAKRFMAALAGFASTLAQPARLHVRAGDPVERICELVGERSPDLLVVGRNLEGGTDGSMRDRLLLRSPVPVLVAGPGSFAATSGVDPLRRILVSVEHGPDGASAVATALALGERAGAETIVREGDSSAELLASVRETQADLLVVSRGGDRSDDLGGRARLLAREAAVPVLIVPGAGGRRPRPQRRRGPTSNEPLPAA